MSVRQGTRGVAGAARRVALAVLITASALAAPACQRATEPVSTRTLTTGAPVVPSRLQLPPDSALLETITPWRQPRVDTNGWQLAITHLNANYRLTYRVPYRWNVDGRGRGQSLDGLVQASAQWTTIDDTGMSLAAYAASLADGRPIHAISTPSGHTVYATSREVSVAPSDPNVERFMFHTAVVDIDGRVAKFEVKYDSDHRWRFDELANAIVGTVDIVPSP